MPQADEAHSLTPQDGAVTMALVLQELGALRAETTGLYAKLDQLKEEIKALAPNGDIDGHRRYHEQLIDIQTKRTKLVDTLTEKIVTGIVWAVMGGVCTALWAWIKAEAKHP